MTCSIKIKLLITVTKRLMDLPTKKDRHKEESGVSIYKLNIFASCITFGILIYLAGDGVFSCKISSKLLDKKCLNCFCQALTGCNDSFGCQTLNKKEYCGPYQISYAYWLDGGMQGNTNPNTIKEDYIKCTQNRFCAEWTLQEFNMLYCKDCNGNGIIDCVDFFRTHIAGPTLCMNNSLEDGAPWLKFLECYLNAAENTEYALRSIRGAKSN